mgnify:CR=1 FL=1
MTARGVARIVLCLAILMMALGFQQAEVQAQEEPCIVYWGSQDLEFSAEACPSYAFLMLDWPFIFAESIRKAQSVDPVKVAEAMRSTTYNGIFGPFGLGDSVRLPESQRHQKDLVEVVRLAGSGQLRPVIGAHYPLGAIDDAAERLERGELVTGELVQGRPVVDHARSPARRRSRSVRLALSQPAMRLYSSGSM